MFVSERVRNREREEERERERRDKTGQDGQMTMVHCMALRISETELGRERLEVMGLASGRVLFYKFTSDCCAQTLE